MEEKQDFTPQLSLKKNGLDAYKTFLNMFVEFEDFLNKQYNNGTTTITIAMNHILSIFSIQFDALFKYFYFRWTHQMLNMPLNFSMRDIEIPEDLMELRRRISKYPEFIKSTFILDRDAYRNTLQGIQYYYRRGLITNDEIALIQADFYRLMNLIENGIRYNENNKGLYTYYLSGVKIHASVAFCKTDEFVVVSFWTHMGNQITIRDSEICETHRIWLQSLKKYSSLISECNELLRIKFIEKQREYIENVTNKEYAYE
jgi:hypothetical protein